MIAFALVYGGLALLGALMALAQRRWPARDVPAAFDRARANDWAWWVVSPLGTGTLTRVLTLGLAGALAYGLGYGLDAGAMLLRFQRWAPVPATRHPLALQLVEALVVADVLGYWSHRARHSRWLWPFHAVHHSPRRLDWLSAARMHPVDDALDNVTVGAALLACFDARVFALVGPVLIVHTVYLHAAVTWDLGPLRYVLASPAFHRWHHAADGARRGRNFAGMFSLLDVAFGTFELPMGREPDAYGTPDDPVPDTLAGQLLYPLLAHPTPPERSTGGVQSVTTERDPLV